MLVLAADLEQVEEVGCRGMDGNEVFVRIGIWRGQVDDFQVFRPLSSGQLGQA